MTNPVERGLAASTSLFPPFPSHTQTLAALDHTLSLSHAHLPHADKHILAEDTGWD